MYVCVTQMDIPTEMEGERQTKDSGTVEDRAECNCARISQSKALLDVY